MNLNLRIGNAFVSFGSQKKRMGGRRSFEAAKGTRFTGDFLPTDGTGDKHLKRNAKALRERARTLETDDGYAEGILNELESNVIGPKGISVTPKARKRDGRAGGGMTRDVDKAACERLENAWNEFSKKGSYDVTREFSRPQMERLTLRSVARDGEAFTRVVPGYPHNDFNFAVQGLEADLLDLRYSDDKKKIHMGIEFDEWDARVAYHFDKAGQNEILPSHLKERERFEADSVYHLFSSKRFSQSRGYSWLTPIMLRLRHLGKFEESEVIMARYGAMKIGFFKRTGESQFEGEEDEEGVIKAPVQPGEWEELPPGIEPHHIDPSHPNSDYPDFRKAMLRGVCAALPINYNTLAKDLEGVSFSSIRQGTLSERDAYRIIQGWFIDEVTQPVYDDWLRMALSMRTIEGLTFEDYDRCCHCDFEGRSWAWVDPLKDIQAAKGEILLGINSRQAIAKDRGKSFSQNVEENGAAQEELLTAGLPTGMEQSGQAGEVETEEA